MRTTLCGILAASLLIASCKKEPGEGGKAEIRGVVMRQDVNAVGNPIGDPYPYPETRVYIVYGDNDFYDDDVRTGPNGEYVFSWLRKGDYTVYTFSEQCDCNNDLIAIRRTVSISDRKESVVVPTITALNY